MAAGKRSGGGAFRDPVLGLAVSVVGLPTLVSLMHRVGTVTESLGWVVPGYVSSTLWIVFGTVCALMAAQPMRKIFQAGKGAYQRSQALKDLPGPSYGLLGILPLLRTRKDLHRQVTEWAEQYGPIYRVRVATFHVCPPPPACLLGTLSATVVLNTGYAAYSHPKYFSSQQDQLIYGHLVG